MDIELSNVQTVAIAKSVKDATAKVASAGVAVGEYDLDFTVRVKGKVTKGADYDQEIVAKVDFALLAAVLLGKVNGVTMDSVIADYLNADPAQIDDLKLKAAEAIQKVKAATVTRCQGKITTKLSLTAV